MKLCNEVLAYRYWKSKGFNPFGQADSTWRTNSKGKIINQNMLNNMQTICGYYNISISCLNDIIGIAVSRDIARTMGTLGK